MRGFNILLRVKCLWYIYIYIYICKFVSVYVFVCIYVCMSDFGILGFFYQTLLDYLLIYSLLIPNPNELPISRLIKLTVRLEYRGYWILPYSLPFLRKIPMAFFFKNYLCLWSLR